MKRILVACEYSGTVRDAFAKRGWDAWSCDLLPTERPGQHIQGDAWSLAITSCEQIGWRDWDLMICHPPCGHLASSGAQYWPAKQQDGRQTEAVDFFMRLTDLRHVERVAIENPVGIMSRLYRKPDQIIQPWQFGDPFNKKTCLWLKNLPALVPTNVVTPTHNWGSNSYRSGSRKKSPLPSLHWGGKERSRSFQGIADAMAEQWGSL